MNLHNLKIVIFGGTGLVGSSLVEKLSQYQLELFYPNRDEISLFKYQKINNYLNKISPDFVINCAGKVGGIAINNENQYEFLFKNLEIGKNIISSCIENKVSNFINLGSSCMYPSNILNRKLKENDILSGAFEKTNEGYALAKVAILKLCQFTNKKNNNNFKTLIPCNLYGPNDKFDTYRAHLIPAIINKVHNAKVNNVNEIEIWGSGEVRREFMFSGDLADFIIFAINNWNKIPEVVNVGMGKDLSVNEYYKKISEILDWSGSFYHNTIKPDGIKNKLMNTDIINNLGWTPKTDLKTGIKITYDFYKNTLVA